VQYLKVHPQNPQARLISQAAAVVRGGGVVVYPTDSCYALGCQIGDKAAMERIRRLRNLDVDHEFTLVCRDLSDIAAYARVGNREYRFLRMLTPGPYTVILPATREVPRRLQNPKRRTIGLRVPDHPIVRMLLEALGEPLMSVTLIVPGSDLPLTDPEDVRDLLKGQVDLVIDGGNCGYEPTSVVDLTGETPVVVRQGKGELSFLAES
jgi:tRNA threonylcarbamoyl adenosine modification protein (Sua5/YciO/YrdC/YwlC family)